MWQFGVTQVNKDDILPSINYRSLYVSFIGPDPLSQFRGNLPPLTPGHPAPPPAGTLSQFRMSSPAWVSPLRGFPSTRPPPPPAPALHITAFPCVRTERSPRLGLVPPPQWRLHNTCLHRSHEVWLWLS